MSDLNQLSDRDRAILEHVERYRVTTDDVLAEVFFFPAKSVNAAQKVAARLTEAGWLRKSKPLARRNVYSLGPSYGQINSTVITRPFTEQSLPPAIAVLYFCIRNGHKRLTLEDFKWIDAKLCEAATRTLPSIVCPHEGGLGIKLLLVDRASPSRRVIWKLKRVVGQRIDRPAYFELIRAKRMSVTVLVPIEDRVESLSREIHKHFRSKVSVSVSHVPEYAPFVLDLPKMGSAKKKT